MSYPISYFEVSLLHCRRVSLGSDTDMADLGLAGTWVTWPWPSGMATPAVEKEAAAAAMPAATKWEVDWLFDPDLENLNKILHNIYLATGGQNGSYRK